MLALVPVRKEPSERSEMVTQILCGETYEILEIQDNWSLIRIFYDKYEGWINNKMISDLSEDRFHFINQQNSYVLKDAAYKCDINKNTELNWIPGGSSFIVENSAYYLGNSELHNIPDSLLSHYHSAKNITDTAVQFLHSPYLWGGKSIFGIDCSGLTQVVYKICGINILRDASQQAEKGILIQSLNQIQPGDLAFFKRDDGYIVHTGIILNSDTIIHASGKVRIDNIDSHGIINAQDKKYSHILSHIRRMN